jgi:hypothetical protein
MLVDACVWTTVWDFYDPVSSSFRRDERAYDANGSRTRGFQASLLGMGVLPFGLRILRNRRLIRGL